MKTLKKTRTELEFDNLNRLNEVERLNVNTSQNSRKYPEPIPYKDFFGKMYISPKQMKSRIGLAEQIEDVMLYVFAYWSIAASVGITEDEIRQDAKDKMRLVLAKHSKLDSYLQKHIDKTVDEIIDTTIKHANIEDKSDYWLSRDRAMLISENAANSIDNYVDYREAAISGRKTKRWITEADDKVRITHEIAEGQTVDIDGLFLVGDSLMRFPMDTMYDADPKEIINCRCSVIYE